jgi:hypothetical protein
MIEPSTAYSLFSWNVRGLNSLAKQEEVRQVINLHKPLVVSLQETRLAENTIPMINNIMGPMFSSNFRYLPAEVTRGRILLTCKDDGYQFTDILIKCYTISVTVVDSRTNSQWTLAGVYGPQEDFDKRLFLRELWSIKDLARPTWLVMGDFNLIYLDQDKSNGRLNRRMMTRFTITLNHMEVREVPLLGRCFTWSNDHASPTMSKIDRVFCTVPWEEIHLHLVLHSLSASVSDHCPLMLRSQEQFPHPPIFRFEAHWPLMPGFAECVNQAWSKPIQSQHNTLMNLHIKMARTATSLSSWARQLIPIGKLTAVICR